MMKILLVYCNSPHEITVPIGITQLRSTLLRSGNRVEIFHTTFYKQREKSTEEIRAEGLQFKDPGKLYYEPTDMCEDFVRKVEEFEPDMIGFSVLEPTFNMFNTLLGAIEGIVREHDMLVAVGGVHARLAPEEFGKIELVDIIATSESEETFPELCNRIESKENYYDVPGYWIRDANSIGGWKINPATSLVDINRMPPLDPTPYGDKFMMKPMMGKLNRSISVEISRGCPYECTYCADPAMAQKAKAIGKYLRFKSIPRLEEEYDQVISKFKPDFIYKLSETFLAAPNKWLLDYYEVYKKYKIPFWIESRPETINDENIRLLADLNCVRFSMGLESGNEKFRRTTLKRGYTNAKLLEAAGILKKYGISFTCNLILGFPFETRSMISDGIDILRQMQPDGISVFLFTPYTGSALRQVCVDHDMIDPDIICDDYFQDVYSLRNNGFTQDERVGLRRTIPLYVTLPEKKFPLIKKAEELTDSGNDMFNKLKEEFYDIKGWG